MREIPRVVLLFSPMFAGNDEQWQWICDKTNSRRARDTQLTPEQVAYAQSHGWLPYVDVKT